MDLLIPRDQYMKVGIHIGTRFRTKFMEKFIFKIRPDGLSILNIELIDERIRLAAKMLSRYKPEDVLIACRRNSGQKAMKALKKYVGFNTIAGRYLPGSLTNPSYEYYMEPEIVMVTDPWLDRQVIKDALQANLPIISICDSNNTTQNIDLVIPGNNKSGRSISMIYYLIAREYCKLRGMPVNFEYKDFT